MSDLIFTAVDFTVFPKGDYRPVATINRTARQLAKQFQFPYEEYEEDGLGLTGAMYFQTNQGRGAVLLTRLQSSFSDQGVVELLNNETILAGDLDGLLCFLKLTTQNLIWVKSGLEFPRYEVWRQDDHGHQYLIKTVTGRADALHEVEHFESLGHKQTYWSRKAPQ